MMNCANSFRVHPEDIESRDILERIDINQVSEKEFIDVYEKNYRPVVIRNAQTTWVANDKWTVEVHLEKSFRKVFIGQPIFVANLSSDGLTF